jgi:hypothetical protein
MTGFGLDLLIGDTRWTETAPAPADSPNKVIWRCEFW